MKKERLHPFVRLAHSLSLSPASRFRFVKTYDARLFFCRLGAGAVFADGIRFEMEKNSLLLLPPGCEYRILPAEENTEYIALNFDYTQAFRERETPVVPMEEGAFSETAVFAAQAEEIFFPAPLFLSGEKYLPRLKTILEEYCGKRRYYEIIASALLAEILCGIARDLTGPVRRQETQVEEILAFLQFHFTEPLSVAEIADRFHLHKTYVNTLLKKATGMSVHRYILSLRLDLALSLLESGAMRVSEVAEKCGFYDVYHLSRAVKKATGAPPSFFIHGGYNPKSATKGEKT